MSENSFGTGQPGQDAFPPVDSLSYEQARDELIETVKILELGQMGLDESLKYWERGEALAKACESHLDGASKRVEAALNTADSEPEGASEDENTASPDSAEN